MTSKPIRIAATGVAEFVGSTPAQRRNILRPYKRQQSGEARGRGHYYRVSLNSTKRFFRAKNDRGILSDAIRSLELRRTGSLGRRELAQIRHNIRVLNAIRQHYAGRVFTLIQGMRLECNIGKIQVTCTPDLWVDQNGKLLFVKFFFPEKKPKTMQIPVLLHLLREGAHNAGLDAGVICLDMEGVEHQCPKDRTKMQAVVASFEKDIQDTWNTIPEK